MGTHSEEERREMRELAASKKIRDEFRLLRSHSLHKRRVKLDEFIRFLTVTSCLTSRARRRRRFVDYTQVKL
jgi:hypothetical protein